MTFPYKIEVCTMSYQASPTYRLFRKEPGWFKPWVFVQSFETERDAVEWIKSHAAYPVIHRVERYDDRGRQEVCGW